MKIDTIQANSHAADIRALCTIHSANAGGLLSIPREGKLVRMYIHLKDIKLGIDGRLDKSQVTPQVLLETAQKILSPYKFTCNYVDWWTAYQVSKNPCVRCLRS